MPKIPKFRAKSTPQQGPIPPEAVPVKGLKTAAAVAKLGENLMDFGIRLERRRQNSINNTFVSTNYTQDIIDANTTHENAKLDAGEDGSGYVEAIDKFYDERIAQRRADAPSDAAFQAYSEKINLLRAKSIISAQNYETQKRYEWSKAKQEDLINQYASQQLIAPNPDQALEYAGDIQNLIVEQIGEIYTQEQASEMIDASNRKIFTNLISGLIKGDNPERALSVLRSTVNKEQFDESLVKNAMEDGTVYDDSEDFSKIIGQSLTPADKGKFLTQSIQAIKAKNRRDTISDNEEIKNLGMAYRSMGDSPALDTARDKIFDRVQRDPNRTASEKAQIIDNINMDIALGNAVKRTSRLPMDKKMSEVENYLDEEIKLARTRLNESVDRMEILGLPKKDADELRETLESAIFNFDKVAGVRQSAKSLVEKDIQKFNKESALYLYSNFEKIKNLSAMATNPEATPMQRTAAFQTYAQESDNLYNYLNLPIESRKLLTPGMSLYYSRILNNPNLNAAEGLQAIHNLQREHGHFANRTFNEMAKRGHINANLFSLAQIDPTAVDQAETLYAIMKEKDGYTRIRDGFDRRRGDQIDLDEQISESLDLLQQAVKRSDPSGRSLYTVRGLEDLMRIGVMSDFTDRDERDVTKSVERWKKVLVNPYKTVERNGSIAFTKWDTAQHHNDLETFLGAAHGPSALIRRRNSLESQLVKLGISAKFAPEPRWVDQATELNDMGLVKDKMNERLDSVEFVMNPAYDGLIMMHSDTGVRRPFRDSFGKPVEIPLSRLSEFDFTPSIEEVKETEEDQIRSILESKFGTGGFF